DGRLDPAAERALVVRELHDRDQRVLGALDRRALHLGAEAGLVVRVAGRGRRRRRLVQALLGQRGVELPARRPGGPLRVRLLELLGDYLLERLQRLRAPEVTPVDEEVGRPARAELGGVVEVLLDALLVLLLVQRRLELVHVTDDML